MIAGHKISVNLCSIYHQDKFMQWAFNCHYGFFGNVLKYLNRYGLLGDKRLEASFMKALTKKKFRYIYTLCVPVCIPRLYYKNIIVW